jgi:hypothetical protein
MNTNLTGKILAGAALAAALGGLWFQARQTEAVRKELATTQQTMTQMRGELSQSVATAKQQADEQIAKVNEKMAAEVAAAQKASQNHAVRVQAVARQQTGKALKELTEKNELLLSQLDSLKKDSESKSTQVDESLSNIKGDVGTVRSEVAATRNELDKTIADLKRVNGDMGVMSGLIATNANELDALKKLGDRDYYEFTLNKSAATPVRIAGIQLALKKSDNKRSKFTMDVIADDRKIEKKDKNLNEPVQFYTSHGRIPLEVVVNAIGKDQVKGYLAVPKVRLMARN